MIDWLTDLLAFAGSFLGAWLAIMLDKKAQRKAEQISRYRRSDGTG